MGDAARVDNTPTIRSRRYVEGCRRGCVGILDVVVALRIADEPAEDVVVPSRSRESAEIVDVLGNGAGRAGGSIVLSGRPGAEPVADVCAIGVASSTTSPRLLMPKASVAVASGTSISVKRPFRSKYPRSPFASIANADDLTAGLVHASRPGGRVRRGSRWSCKSGRWPTAGSRVRRVSRSQTGRRRRAGLCSSGTVVANSVHGHPPRSRTGPAPGGEANCFLVEDSSRNRRASPSSAVEPRRRSERCCETSCG